jgi:hypothetical protein
VLYTKESVRPWTAIVCRAIQEDGKNENGIEMEA